VNRAPRRPSTGLSAQRFRPAVDGGSSERDNGWHEPRSRGFSVFGLSRYEAAMRIKELLLALAAIVVVASCGLLPCTQPWRPRDDWRTQSQSSLKMIGLALHSYHDTHRKWPPAVVTDKLGKPLYSWRVLLLPFLEQNELYKQFKLDEPWDSPANRQLLEKRPPCYWQSGDEPPGTTRYQAIVGRGTAWERPDLTFQHGFPDGTGNTIMVVEAANPAPWSKPADLEFDPKGALPVVGGPHSVPVSYFFCYVTKRVQGFNALFVDASVRFMRTDIAPDVLRAMLTRNGGEKVPLGHD
jgi:hypothetical protein